MTGATLFTGIRAPEVAAPWIDWKWGAEIEKFSCAVMKHYAPEVPNLGDVTADDFIDRALALGPVDVIVFGSPCQDFSVAGKRGGIDAARGNLALRSLEIIDRLRPTWFLFENVHGLLSSDEGRAFETFLWKVESIGFHCAWNVCDAQWFGVPQRRERIFAVGHSGDWRYPIAVLSEFFSLSGHPAPRRETREDVAGTLGGGSGKRGLCSDTDKATFLAETSPTLRAGGNSTGGHRPPGTDVDTCETLIAGTLDSSSGRRRGSGIDPNQCVAHALRADGFDASEDGTGRGTPIIAFSYKDSGNDVSEVAPTLRSMNHSESHSNGGGQIAVAFTERTRANGRNLETQEELAYALGNPASGGATHSRRLLANMQVRRLTPLECERLQGFPDYYSAVTYRGKLAADGPRYRAIGNSMAVPVLSYLLKRIEFVNSLSTTDFSNP